MKPKRPSKSKVIPSKASGFDGLLRGGAARAEYRAKLLPRLAEKLTAEFGRGFDVRSLEKMRQFYLAFPICDALRHELSWTHYRTLMRVEDTAARET